MLLVTWQLCSMCVEIQIFSKAVTYYNTFELTAHTPKAEMHSVLRQTSQLGCFLNWIIVGYEKQQINKHVLGFIYCPASAHLVFTSAMKTNENVNAN